MMTSVPTKLQPPVNPARAHISGPIDAAVTFVECGDYQCPYCRRAHSGIKRLRDERPPAQWIGSMNRYITSWIDNCELNAVVDDEDFGRKVADMYEQDFHTTMEIVLGKRNKVRLSKANNIQE
jgi:hypothetical protein